MTEAVTGGCRDPRGRIQGMGDKKCKYVSIVTNVLQNECQEGSDTAQPYFLQTHVWLFCALFLFLLYICCMFLSVQQELHEHSHRIQYFAQNLAILWSFYDFESEQGIWCCCGGKRLESLLRHFSQMNFSWFSSVFGNKSSGNITMKGRHSKCQCPHI